jgi:hypothetical protein
MSDGTFSATICWIAFERLRVASSFSGSDFRSVS